MNYRQDIDGLRAIAVMAVVLFHLDFAGFDGGYVGVDVFFVISGYLITSLIQKKLAADEFRLTEFYARRVRRLYPPLLATVAVTVFAAGFLLEPLDMIGFGRSAVAALLSVSNISFFFEAGYWDSASELKPLLHTWSLGVEEQFYLFWPAILMLLFKLREYVSFTQCMFAVASAGFFLCFWVTGYDQPAAFYLLPFRVFQFALGALIIPIGAALTSAVGVRYSHLPALLLLTGLALILVSVVTLGDGSQFPGWVVLLPSIGAALCLLSGTDGTARTGWLSSILSNPVSMWLGRVSYSLYLVHWPIIALYRYEKGLDFELSDKVLLAMLTLVATCVLHYGVERQLYMRAGYKGSAKVGISSRAVFSGVLASLITLILLGSSAWLIDGWSWRESNLQFSPAQIREGEQARYKLIRRACRVDYPDDHPLCDSGRATRVLIIGNSHEVDGYNIARTMFSDRSDVELILFGNINPCGEVGVSDEGFVSKNDGCQKRLDALFSESFIDRLDAVIYSANRPFAINKGPALSVIVALKKRRPDVPVVTLGGYINTERRCTFYINRSGDISACALAQNVTYFADDPSAQPLYDEFMRVTDHFLDKVDVLCEARQLDSCVMMTKTRVPAFYDTSHLSLEFAQMLGRLFLQQDEDVAPLF